MKFESKSKEGQDILVHKLLGNQGFFLDVGCAQPVGDNNTYALEKSGWDGLLFDWAKDPASFLKRKATYFKVDVASPEFVDILSRESPRDVDYISLDVEESSEAALKNILDNNIKFKVMTFEHNSHADRGSMRDSSRELLFEAGYKILFGDVRMKCRRVTVFFALGGKRRTVRNWGSFEDWWINPDFFEEELMHCASKDIFWEDCVDLIPEKQNFYRKAD